MVLRCRVKVWSSGDKHWFPVTLEDKGKVVKSFPQENQKAIFMVTAEDLIRAPQTKPGKTFDLRNDPVFHQILPCPHCGVEEDRNHDVLKHVDSRFGTPIHNH